eukprot:Gregarina_sp_Poly_1__9449@NODE_592_length_7334_cov_17_757259_g457_i0_p2_GENE_NODE_592_length_7334_cov_17_757259_g457_i0NODE_592_length_7334_cov_17_757259_g457_i0_p2_ORF_typecomplete_len290_score29_95_NODE_592_length_7334_cov_17_757259_g457_i050685937
MEGAIYYPDGDGNLEVTTLREYAEVEKRINGLTDDGIKNLVVFYHEPEHLFFTPSLCAKLFKNQRCGIKNTSLCSAIELKPLELTMFLPEALMYLVNKRQVVLRLIDWTSGEPLPPSILISDSMTHPCRVLLPHLLVYLRLRQAGVWIKRIGEADLFSRQKITLLRLLQDAADSLSSLIAREGPDVWPTHFKESTHTLDIKVSLDLLLEPAWILYKSASDPSPLHLFVFSTHLEEGGQKGRWRDLLLHIAQNAAGSVVGVVSCAANQISLITVSEVPAPGEATQVVKSI